MGYAISQQLSISLLPLYLRGCPTNIMSLKPSPTFITAYLFVIGLQFGIMHIQQTKGPKYLIPKRFRAQQYNYLQTFIDTTDLESGTLTANAPETGEECVICMYTLRNQVNNEMQPMPNMISNTYMRTPCRHKFHQNCLQNWMRVKLECPVCREVLPPFETDE
ncbi:hypothetical protein FGO68_gene392 [Halteria grandinella]|uniref:RING-type E3 ubiquitin transferase n=1 Tax=Halteria grandinella TaxID=5974 RepID=A0A8J8NSK0_HALGN|nr:hypothetical protein FGO68_gene392 [Halteria grandinella]